MHAPPSPMLALHISSGSALQSGVGVISLQWTAEPASNNSQGSEMLSCSSFDYFDSKHHDCCCRGEHVKPANDHPQTFPPLVESSVTTTPSFVKITPACGGTPKASALTMKGVPLRLISPACSVSCGMPEQDDGCNGKTMAASYSRSTLHYTVMKCKLSLHT